MVQSATTDVSPPHPLLTVLEVPLALAEYAGFTATSRLLSACRSGHGRPVLVLPGLLSGEPADHPVDAHGIQPLFAGMLARACGLSVAMAANGDGILLTAAPAAG